MPELRKVFISHSHKDEPLASAFRDTLKNIFNNVDVAFSSDKNVGGGPLVRVELARVDTHPHARLPGVAAVADAVFDTATLADVGGGRRRRDGDYQSGSGCRRS